MIKLYGIKNCDTMKKARAWLDQNQLQYEFHDYKKAGIERKLLSAWVKQHGWEAVLNRRGTTYRKLSDEIRNNMDESAAINAMLDQPSMIKRPILVSAMQVLVGFNADQYTEALL